MSKDELIATPEAQNELLKKDIDVGFPLVDMNNDGVITKLENNKAQMIAYEFNQLDTNKDGSITELELNVDFPYSEVQMFMNKFSSDISKNKMNLFDF